MTSGISISTLEIRKERISRFNFINALSGPQLQRVFFVNNSVCVQRSLEFSRGVITLSTSLDNLRALP